jgi:Transglutaminase-like superfamily
MKRYLILVLVLTSIAVKAQLGNTEVDKLMLKIPNSQTNSITSIAKYIQDNFKSDSNKIRAIYFFTATHIDYDVDNMFAINFNETTENKIEKGLKTRKGVCMHYSEVFNAIAKELNFESYVVEGMTKQNGTTDGLAHAWNAAKLNGKWYLFDATWGSGNVNQGRFIKKLDNQYYKVIPSKLAKSHYPFDYLWQFSPNPLKANDFLYSRPSSGKVKIDYEKLLQELPKLNEVERLNAAVERIEANGLSHSIIFDRYSHLKQTATIIPYNEAVADYNEAVKKFNEYIQYRNKQFTPVKTDEEIKKMIRIPKQLNELASIKLTSLKNIDKSLGINPESLLESVIELEKNIQEQNKFVDDYINTKPGKRKGLFYTRTVTLFGIPLTK